MQPAPPLPPPGWYADPWRLAAMRWWDGRAWTGWAWGPPGQPAVAGPLTDVDPDADAPSPTFSLRGALLVALGTVLAIFAARAIGDRFDPRDAGLATATFYVVLFGGMLGSCVAASRWFGSGSLRDDFGWRVRRIDAGWGMIAFVASIVARVIFVAIVGVGDTPTEDLGEGLRDNRDVLAVFAIAALVGAPLFEELVFRGAIQRGLTRAAGAWVAVPVQGVLFGFYHVVGAFDIASVFYVGTLSVIGVVLGVAADRTGRLGAAMVAHAVSNLVALALTLAFL